jgi:hypothetical protein
MERRLFKSNERVAHRSLEGSIDNRVFVDGTFMTVVAPIANLLSARGGALERQLLFGDVFCVLEIHNGLAFGFEKYSGYVGYVSSEHLGGLIIPTHQIATMGAHVYPEQSIKTVPNLMLPFGAVISAISMRGDFWEIEQGFVSIKQVTPITELVQDVAATALRFLGVPYLWGGDSNLGIDCSGLVHTALKCAKINCPRDSDQQAAFFPVLDASEELQRGDLVFWKGHVAIMIDAVNVVHANGHHMSVTVENLDKVANRIYQIEQKRVNLRSRPVGLVKRKTP